MLPIAFHAVPLGGRILLPMHIPALIAGLLLGPAAGLVVGAGSPVLSMLLTGRPTVFYMVPMVFELAAYGVVAGVTRPLIGRALARRPYLALVLALVAAMLVGRIVWITAVVWLAPVLGIQARTAAAALAALGAGWIGAALQLAVIPPIVRAVERPRAA